MSIHEKKSGTLTQSLGIEGMQMHDSEIMMAKFLKPLSRIDEGRPNSEDLKNA
ncbi:MAG: hypothetical protein JSV05_00285 [Candidatus Bathyarchaeota archaeon]|nr:MAG: hypothetical protein JSV05_00285 [Candidatus Bathyarchaeota archaeon]